MAGAWGRCGSTPACSRGTSTRRRRLCTQTSTEVYTCTATFWTGSARTSRERSTPSRTSSSSSSGARPFSGRSSRRCARSRTARRPRTARSLPSPGTRTPAARSARSAPRTASHSWCRATAWSPPMASARTARSGPATSSAFWSSRVSFSEDVRAELAAIAPERECDRIAELSALFHFAGRLHLRGRGEVSLHLDLSSGAVARRAFSLLRSFGVDSEIRTYRQRAFGRETRYQLHVEGSRQLLERTGVVDARSRPRERPPRRLLGRSCCRAAYLRGALLAAGSVSPPPSLHLEVRCETRAGAERSE